MKGTERGGLTPAKSPNHTRVERPCAKVGQRGLFSLCLAEHLPASLMFESLAHDGSSVDDGRVPSHMRNVAMTRVLILLLVTVFSTGPRSAAAGLLAGAARVDSTPAQGVSMNGPISKPGPAKGVHDRLHVRALVLESGKSRIAIAVCDNCVVGSDVIDAAKHRIHEANGFPIDHILVSATHTHAAPRAAHISSLPIDREYHAQLSEWIAEAILKANDKLVPARLGYTSFDRGDLLKCRRDLCEPGTVGANPFGHTGERVKSVSGSSSAIIEPAGPVDPEFSVVSVQTLDGKPICTLGNFSIHYCGGYGGGLISADYFGYFAEAIEAGLGNGCVGIMSNGTSGNTGSFTRSGRKLNRWEGMQIYGRMLAQDTLRAMEQIRYEDDVALEMLESTLDLKVRKPDAQRLEWARRALTQPRAELPHRWSHVYANEALHLHHYPDYVQLKVQALRIGSLAIAASPCETFAETGLAIKRDSPHKHTFTIELANGYGGYLPPREQHALGGYETWPARSSYLEVGAEEAIRSEIAELLKQLADDSRERRDTR